MKEKVGKLMDEGFALISTIPVTGDSVEVMAKAKGLFRAAYQALESLEEIEQDEVNADG